MGELDAFWTRIGAVAQVLFARVLGWRVDVQGLEHVPQDGGAILAFNHHGYVDVVFVCWGPLLQLGRPVRFLAKAELFRHRASGWLVRAAGCVPVERAARGGDSRVRAYRAGVEALRAGELVAIAPEQTISASYELLPFKPGAARMAVEAGVPLVPAVGWGSHRAIPKGHPVRLRRRIPVTIRYGEPVVPGPGERDVEVNRRLRERMESMLLDVQATYPDAAAGRGTWWMPARLGGTAPAHDAVVAAHAARFGIDQRARQRDREERAHRSHRALPTAQGDDRDLAS